MDRTGKQDYVEDVTDGVTEWCNSDPHTLSEQAKDRAKWRLVVQCVVDTHGH